MKSKNAGDLVPFCVISLVAQIMTAIRQLPDDTMRDDQKWLVFSPQEEAQITALSNQAIGGLETNQGLGHGMSGNRLFLTKILDRTGLYVTGFPAGLDPQKPVTDEDGWLLAIQGF